MLKATITYSSDLVRFRRLEMEMSFLESELLADSGMQVQFQFRDHKTNEVEIFCKGLLGHYKAWSESPVALTLRALHALYTDWHESIPAELRQQDVASMQIVVTYARAGEEDTPLTSVSLTKEPDRLESYSVLRSSDAAAAWPLQIRAASAVPLGIALKLLAFENSAPINFSTFPPAPQVAAHTDDDRRRVVSMTDLPDYAVPAFRTYLAGKGSYRQGDSRAPFGRWQSFLRS
jgi:hypothetical protein